MDYVVRLVNSVVMSPLLYFLYCEMSSFARFNVRGNVMIVVKAFRVSTDGRTGRKHYGKGNQINFLNLCLFQQRQISAPSMGKEVYYNQPATRLILNKE